MSDDTDDRTLAASAYLDDEAAPDERAMIEAHPEAQADVESLGRVRTLLGATAPQPSLSSREAHLAAALDVFDRMSDLERTGEATPAAGIDEAAAAALSTPLSSSDTGRHRRPERSNRSTWLLSAAAGLLVLAGVGAVVANVVTSGDDDDGGSDAAVLEDSGEVASEVDAVEDLADDELLGSADDAVVASDTFGDEDVFNASEASDDATLTDAMDDAADDDSDAADAVADSAGGDDGAVDDAEAPPPEAEVPPPPPAAELDVLVDDDDLAAFATLAIPALGPDGEYDSEDVDYEPPAGSCEARFDAQKRAGLAIYKGQTVQVGIDLDQRIVYAYTEDDCQLIGQTQLPDDPRDSAQPVETQP